MDLTQKKCVPCEVGTAPLAEAEIQELLPQVDKAWKVIDSKKLEREFVFKDFQEAMGFVNEVAKIAEEEGHHPDLHIFYNKIKIELWTHASNGLSENDFILAAKIDKLLL